MPDLFDLPFDADEGPSPPPSPPDVLTVSALTAAIREHLEQTFFEVWIEGEVSNARLWNGILYFTLKDAGAQLRAVMFRTAVRRLTFTVEDGQHVLARGRVSVYDQRGEYQLICEHVEPRGLGALQRALEQLKKRLAAEGLFEVARKRALPLLPRTIGVVTSLEGAALHDIIRVITRRHARVHLVIRPSRVQGEGAAGDLARGLAAVTAVPGVDVVIIGRGGGSIEDLWAFNEEVLVRAIAASPVPVVSAVGHEVDWTLADAVADLRAATPSQAAELVIAPADEFRQRIARARERLRATLYRGVETRRARVQALVSRRGFAGVPLRIGARARRVDDLATTAERLVRQATQQKRRDLERVARRLAACDPRRRVADLQTRLVVARNRLRSAAHRRTDDARAALGTSAAMLDALSPLAVLGRGYALCWAADGRVLLRDATPDLVGRRVSVDLARGALDCQVTAVVPAATTPSPPVQPQTGDAQ